MRLRILATTTASILLLTIPLFVGASSRVAVKTKTIAATVKPVAQIRVPAATLFDRVSPSVVEVGCNLGSGFVFDHNGYILTNAHVVAGFSTCNIKLNNNVILIGTVVGTDPVNDLAVIKIDQDLPVLALGDSSQSALTQGSKIYLLGHPLGVSNTIITQGTLTSRHQISNLNYLTTDAAVQAGNSGGPWVNESGQVVGMHEGILGNPDGTASGIGLGIPVNTIKNMVPTLKEPVTATVAEKLPFVSWFGSF
ncbi:MAG: trypsin-like peptidase domain-containing protein [Candidatus Doudnabacteria bacterium]